MKPYFCSVDDLKDETCWLVFTALIEQGDCIISGEVVKFLLKKYNDCIVDCFYEDYAHSDENSIDKWYILKIQKNYYRIHVSERKSDSALIYKDQTIEKVKPREIIKLCWFNREEEEGLDG